MSIKMTSLSDISRILSQFRPDHTAIVSIFNKAPNTNLAVEHQRIKATIFAVMKFTENKIIYDHFWTDDACVWDLLPASLTYTVYDVPFIRAVVNITYGITIHVPVIDIRALAARTSNENEKSELALDKVLSRSPAPWFVQGDIDRLRVLLSDSTGFCPKLDIAVIARVCRGMIWMVHLADQDTAQYCINYVTPISTLLSTCTVRGVGIDTVAAQQLIEKLDAEIQLLERALKESPPTLSQTDIDNSEPRQILDKTNLLRNAVISISKGYISSQGRVHPIHRLEHNTTRAYATDPSLGNLSHTCRHIVVPSTGMRFINVDLKNCEVRVAAGYSGDPQMIEDCLADDMYLLLLQNVGTIPDSIGLTRARKICKKVVLAAIYKRTLWGVKEDYSDPDERTLATTLHNLVHDRYRGLTRFQDQLISEARKKGYIELVPGFKRSLTGLTYNEIPRKVCNNTVQSVAATLFFRCLEKLEASLHPLGAQIVFPLHDSILVEVIPGMERTIATIARTEILEVCGRMFPGVRFEVEITVGNNWACDAYILTKNAETKGVHI